MPRLDDWYVQTIQLDDAYRAPETMPRALVGIVSGHPTRPDGDHIRTSPILRATPEGHIVTLSGTVYELGTVRPGYEAYYPNARARLIEAYQPKAEDLEPLPCAPGVH